jgi:hypothetical protein
MEGMSRFDLFYYFCVLNCLDRLVGLLSTTPPTMIHSYFTLKNFLPNVVSNLIKLFSVFGLLHLILSPLFFANGWSSCFPHVVNLACKAVLAAITNMDFAAEDAEDYDPSGASLDHIATLRTLV